MAPPSIRRAENSTAQFPPDYFAYDDGPVAIRAMSAILALTTVIVTTRFWLRISRSIQLGVDDWSMAVALLLDWSLYAIAVSTILHSGFGKHTAVVILMDPSGHTLKKGQILEYVGQLVYVLLITAVKISILSMYNRIFPTRFVRWGAVILGIIVAMWFLSITFTVIFQCSPISAAWDSTISGICIDKEKFFLGNSIPNILTDLAILVLPMYEVYHLRVNRSQKVGLLFVFLLGGLVVIISIYRLKVLIDIAREGLDADYTREINNANIWTVIEPSIGMISGSLPTLGPVMTTLGRVVGFHSSRSPQDGNGQKKQLNQHSIVTIGSSGKKRKPIHAVGSGTDIITGDEQGSFERLRDADSGSQHPSDLWPSGHWINQNTRVTSGGPADAIHLSAITVKRDVNGLSRPESWKSLRVTGLHRH